MPGPTHPSAISGVFGSPFPEQVAFFRQKLGNLVPTERWDDLLAAEHDRAFMVAGATKAELLSDLAAAVDKAIAEGRGIEDFRKDFREIVARNGWTGWTGEGSIKGEAWRVNTIYRTNTYTSYAAGRFAQLKEGNFKYWVYRHGGSMEPRPQHLSWDGVALPPDHPFWATHYPPSDWGCSCYVVGTNTAAGVRRLGGYPGKALPANWQTIDPRTGAPVGIGKGWDYAPGASVASTVTALARRISSWSATLGAEFGATSERQIIDAWSEWVDTTAAGDRSKPGFLGTLHLDDIASLSKLGQEPASAEIWMPAGLVQGPKATRHLKAGDALDLSQLRLLPQLQRTPQAVLYDLDSGNLLYILRGEDRVPQLAVAVNYRRKINGARKITNSVVSAYRPRMSDIEGRIKGGRLLVLWGSAE